MICNLTDLQCHLIQCGAKFSDNWIKDIEEALAYHRLKSSEDKTIVALAETLEAIQLMCNETTTKTNLTGIIGEFTHEALTDNAPRIKQAQDGEG